MLSESDWKWIQKVGFMRRFPQCKNIGKYRVCLIFRNKMEICTFERVFNDFVPVSCWPGNFMTYNNLDSVWKVEKFIGRR